MAGLVQATTVEPSGERLVATLDPAWDIWGPAGSYFPPSLDVWAHFHGGPPAGEWLLSDADADVSGHGMISGRVRIWSEDGRAVATGGGHCLVTTPRAKPA